MLFQGYINETLIATHTIIDLHVLNEIYVHGTYISTMHHASMISIHVTGARNTVDQLFLKKIIAHRKLGSPSRALLKLYELDAQLRRIQLEVYERNAPAQKIRLQVDPGTIDGKDKLVQIKFGHGSVTAEGPGGKDVKPTTFAGLTENCAAQIVYNFQVKRVKVDTYLFKDPSYVK
ncbi:unnamed protein product [Ixodes hexagonus]